MLSSLCRDGNRKENMEGGERNEDEEFEIGKQTALNGEQCEVNSIPKNTEAAVRTQHILLFKKVTPFPPNLARYTST